MEEDSHSNPEGSESKETAKVNTIIVVPNKSRKSVTLMSMDDDSPQEPSDIVVQTSLPGVALQQKETKRKAKSESDENDVQDASQEVKKENEHSGGSNRKSKDIGYYYNSAKETLGDGQDNVTDVMEDMEEQSLHCEQLQVDDEIPLEMSLNSTDDVLKKFRENSSLNRDKGKIAMLSEKRATFSDEQLNAALQEVIEGNMSIRRVAHVHNIKYNVLLSKLKGHRFAGKSVIGADPALNETEEETLVEWIRSRYKSGFPVKKIELINKVADIVSDGRPTRFKEGVPGEKWFMNFMQRHPNVATLGPSARADSKGVPSKRSIGVWFDTCKVHLSAFGLDSLLHDKRRIGSADELVLCLNHTITKVDTSTGTNSVYLPEEGAGNLTTLIGACADGELMPAMPVFTCKKPTVELVRSVPYGWGVGLSKRGNITKEVFFGYLKNILIPWLADQGRLPFVLFIDKLKSALSVDITDYCSQKGLLIYNLFPNSTFVLQPIYKPIIKVVKKSWNSASHYKNEKQALLNFCPTLDDMIHDVTSAEDIVENFRGCGLFPFDPNAPDYRKCVLSADDKDTMNFSTSDYTLALDVFEDLVGKMKTELFRQNLQGLKLLKSQDAPLYKIWHKILSKVDITRNHSSELQEYTHDKILRSGSRRLPRPDTYLRVVDENDEEEDQELIALTKANLWNFPTISSYVDEPAPLHGEGSSASEINDTQEPGSIVPSDNPHCMSSDYWKYLFLGEKKCEKEREKMKDTRREERNIRKQKRTPQGPEYYKSDKKKMKSSLAPRMCYVCWEESGKLIACKACRKLIHFNCMIQEERQLLSDLYQDNVEFDYVCLPCSS